MNQIEILQRIAEWLDIPKEYEGGMNLTGANLGWANLTGADLDGANLDDVIGADFSHAVNVPSKYR